MHLRSMLGTKSSIICLLNSLGMLNLMSKLNQRTCRFESYLGLKYARVAELADALSPVKFRLFPRDSALLWLSDRIPLTKLAVGVGSNPTRASIWPGSLEVERLQLDLRSGLNVIDDLNRNSTVEDGTPCG